MARSYKPETGLDITIHHEFLATCPGQEVVYATHPQFPAPVCLIWFQRTLVDSIEITSCYTVEAYRRNGIFGKLIKQLQRWWPKKTIATAQASRLARPALVKLGFKQTKNGWFLRP